ncbi:MAG: biopolymer transporter ExbD [Pseudomonadota bacterium]
MDLRPPPRRPRRENIVPMINVVFLLLIFFLMAAQIAPPEPFPVAPPEARAEPGDSGPIVLHLSADGALGFRDVLGQAAVAAAALAADQAPLHLRADRAAEAVEVARVVARLTAAGIRDVRLITVAK